MSFKLNLNAKIKLDTLLKKLISTIKDKPGRRWLDKGLVRELLDMTGFKNLKVRALDLYVHPMEDEIKEIVVLGNELAIYHTTVDDIVLRKSPYWQEVFSICNIKKIMNDKDVIISKGKESLERLHANALALLDLTYTQDDLMLLLEDGRRGLEHKSMEQIHETLDLFVDLLGFQNMSFEWLEKGLQIFFGQKLNGGDVRAFEPIILFDEKDLFLGMKKWTFSPQSDTSLLWFIKYNIKKELMDLEGIDVIKFLADLALEEVQGAKGSIEMK